MIEKMQFLSITGPKDDIDRAIEQHLSKYEFQLESTMTELSETTGLKPFIEINPYRDLKQSYTAYVRNGSKGNKDG